MNFCFVTKGLNVAPLIAALAANDQLWREITARQDYPGSAHSDTETIYLRGPHAIPLASMHTDFNWEDAFVNGTIGSLMGVTLGPRSNGYSMEPVRQTYLDAAKSDAAVADHNRLNVVSKVSAASVLRERDPALFKRFVSEVAEAQDVPDLYIDAHELDRAFERSSVTADDLARAMPELAAQLPEARMANGLVKIPMADYRLSTMQIHGLSALSTSIGEVGVKWMAQGVAQFSGPDRWQNARDFVFDRSPEMLNRANENDRNVAEVINEINTHGADFKAVSAAQRTVDNAKKFAFYGVAMLDMASAMPTWYGAYLKGMAAESKGGLNLSEEAAIEYANRAVRNAHGGGGTKDLAAIQRDKGAMSMATMFYAFQLSALLKTEAAKSRKQRRTLKQIHEDLKELGFEGSYDRVAAFARTWREGQTERVNPASKRTVADVSTSV